MRDFKIWRFPQRTSRRLWVAGISLVLVIGWLPMLPSLASPTPMLTETTTRSTPPEVVSAPVTVAQRAAIAPGSFVAAAVRRVGPAVVRIDTERVVTRQLDPFFDDPFFQRFFGPEFFSRLPREQLQRGQGSGFIVDASGLILTNAHVVDRADRVTVRLTDGRSFEGQVRGVDPLTDLAVIRINPQGATLPVAPLGSSSQIQVGDWAIAVGNPLGLDNTVTLGIISTLNRSSAEVGIPDKRIDFIQTDAAINPGNSGGPLLNENGEVIGINTAIRADAMGIGFAIPIDRVKQIMAQLERGERIAHPYLGIGMRDLTPELARRNNRDPNTTVLLPEVTGVLVVQVMPNSPAANAGIRRGDVILRIENQPVTKAEQVQRIVENARVGQTLQVQIQRGDRTQQLAVRTSELPSHPS
ncbi:HhoA/HhoB/HtrA family serine endopeptidase [Trichothermofontia sp.]